jgi:hypothetical protein
MIAKLSKKVLNEKVFKLNTILTNYRTNLGHKYYSVSPLNWVSLISGCGLTITGNFQLNLHRIFPE